MCSACRRRHKLRKIVNVLAATRKCAHPAAKKALAEIWNAEDRTHALAAVKQFNELFGAKFSNAVANITDDLDELLDLVALVRAGTTFTYSKLVEREEDQQAVTPLVKTAS